MSWFSSSPKLVHCVLKAIAKVFVSYPNFRKIPHAPKQETHQFGGCNTLLHHYRTIGTTLVTLESEPRNSRTQREFQIAVSTISVEVLESFLEDLLDRMVLDEQLFIYREKPTLNTVGISLLGMVVAIAIGLYAVSAGASLLLSFALTVCLAFPFAFLWHFAPQQGATRRMRFAQILSAEISRRHGGDDKGRASTLSGSSRFLEKLLSQNPAGSTQGAAFEIVH